MTSAGLAPTRLATSAIRVSLKPRSAIRAAAALSIWSRRTSATPSPCSRAAIGPLSPPAPCGGTLARLRLNSQSGPFERTADHDSLPRDLRRHRRGRRAQRTRLGGVPRPGRAAHRRPRAAYDDRRGGHHRAAVAGPARGLGDAAVLRDEPDAPDDPRGPEPRAARLPRAPDGPVLPGVPR